MSGRRAPEDELQKALDELRLEFGAALPAKVEDLAAAVRRAQAAPDDAEAWDEAHTKAHRLHGTSGSYGFARVGAAARKIEHALEDVRSDDAEKKAAAWPAIHAGLRELVASPPPRTMSSATMSAPVSIRARQAPHVLVVDDDPFFLRHVEMLAKQQLFVVHTAGTAQAALEVAAREKLDAAILDAHLDAASSFDLARKLRNVTPKLSLAFVSADESVATRVSAAHAGATVFLSKPLGAFELTNAMRQLLAERTATRPRVLIIDDDPDFAELASSILAPHDIETTTEVDSANVLDAIDFVRPDLLLLDVHMPKVNGVDVCRSIRVTQRWQSLPILMLTADGTLETRMRAFEAGADDCMQKPVFPQELLSRVRVRLDRSRLLHEMTHIDPLTRLLSRRAFLEALAPRVSDAVRHLKPLAIALLDVDHFKKVNDRYGHSAGDRVLVGMGELLASRFRLEDLRCRWGGEEFVVAFPGEEATTIATVLERVLAELKEIEFAGGDGAPFNVTFSAGVASFPKDGESTEALINVADERLYAAKRAGRSRVISKRT